MDPFPIWKKWLSYLVEMKLELVRSKLNPDLQLSLVRGRLQLSSTNSIYSFDDFYLNFYSAFRSLEIEKQAISTVLMLGLGLGSVPYILEKKFRMMPAYTIVDFDEAVIYLASKYGLQRLRSPIQIIHADAWSFVKHNNHRKYDMIVVDLFVDDVIPAAFETVEFLNCIRRIMHQQTLILLNRLYRTDADRQKTDRYYKDVFRPTFENSELMLIEGNCILKAIKKPQHL